MLLIKDDNGFYFKAVNYPVTKMMTVYSGHGKTYMRLNMVILDTLSIHALAAIKI